jgi:hypothetical protein
LCWFLDCLDWRFADAGKEASVWGDRANPDGDLLPNLLEYLTGSNPLTPDSGHLRPGR